MKEHVTSVLISSVSGLGAALAGARWWAVVLVICVVLGSTYGMVFLLTKNPRIKRVSTFLITWEASEEHFKPPDSL